MRRPREVLPALVVLLSLAAAAGAAGPKRVRLPSAAETIRERIRAEQLLRGGRGPERTLPGRVRDTELVRVGVTPEGEPRVVVVEQVLEVHGVGDYFVKIPGPVLEAGALPRSTSQPGLRSGSLVWQGFASAGEILAARVRLDPEHERDRLPLAVEVRARIDGEPADPFERTTGMFVLEVGVTNRTGTRVALPSADVDASVARAAVELVRRALDRGDFPAPGSGGIPKSLPVGAAVSETQRRVAAPLAVEIAVAFDDDATDVAGGVVSRERGRTVVTERLLLSGDRLSRRVRFAARIAGDSPRIEVRAVPALPAVSELEGRPAVDRLVHVLAEVARRPDVDAYLGNPDRDGPARTTYSYEVVEDEAGRAPHAAPPPEPSTSAASIVVALFLAMTLGAGLTVWWARS